MPEQPTYHATELSKEATLEEAFKILAFNCIAQVESNAAILVKAYDTEAVHQMRIGLRRLNSLLEFYNNLLKLPETLQSELRWVNQVLSESRDIDTLINDTLPLISKKTVSLNAVSKLNPIIDSTAEKKHRQLTSAVSSKRYSALIQNLKAFVFDSHWRESLPPKGQNQLSEHLDQGASIRLTKLHSTLIKQGKEINGVGRKQLHRIRIAAKRLRYASEFLQSLYPQKKVQPYLKKLSKLQGLLGFLNDSAVANRLLKEIQVSDASFQKEIQIIKLSIQSEAKMKYKKIEVFWNDFVSSKPFWAVKSK
ncbi:MAG: CHAD domain-containing protein [Methylophilus sp.]|nr:CHAD domain-containing protein [Methylophilus sp.]